MFRVVQFTVATALLIGIGGCTTSKIDSNEVDWHDGVAYKHGSDEPFSGKVSWTGRTPASIVQYWNDNFRRAVVAASAEQIFDNCLVSYVGGRIEGDVACFDGEKHPLLTMHFKDGKYEGRSQMYDPGTLKLAKELNWSGGKLDGGYFVYAPGSSQPVSETHWDKGVQSGKMRTWLPDGTAQTDVSVVDNRFVSGVVIDSIKSVTYSGGLLEGHATFFDDAESREGGAARAVVAEGTFAKGLRVGEWKDSAASARAAKLLDPIARDLERNRVAAAMKLQQLLDHAVSHWSNGKLDGLLEGFDSSNNVLVTASYHDGDLAEQYVLAPRLVQAGEQVSAGSPVKGGGDILDASTGKKLVDAHGTGDLMVEHTNEDGLPIFELECTDGGGCVGPTGATLGSIQDLAAEMPEIQPQDVIAYHLECSVVCKDKLGQIVGRAPPR